MCDADAMCEHGSCQRGLWRRWCCALRSSANASRSNTAPAPADRLAVGVTVLLLLSDYHSCLAEHTAPMLCTVQCGDDDDGDLSVLCFLSM